MGLFLLGLAMMILAGAWLVQARIQVQTVKRWPSVNGHILACELKPKVETQADNTASTVYYLNTTYAYEVDGRPLTSDRIRFGGRSRFETLEAAQDVSGRYRVGARVKVFYNPRKPQESVLETARQAWFGPALIAVAGALVMALGMGWPMP